MKRFARALRSSVAVAERCKLHECDNHFHNDFIAGFEQFQNRFASLFGQSNANAGQQGENNYLQHFATSHGSDRIVGNFTTNKNRFAKSGLDKLKRSGVQVICKNEANLVPAIFSLAISAFLAASPVPADKNFSRRDSRDGVAVQPALKACVRTKPVFPEARR